MLTCKRRLWSCLLLSSALAAQQDVPKSATESSVAKAASFIQEGRYLEAQRELLRATQQHPDSAEAFALLGVAEIQLQERAAALTSFEHALKLNPRSTNALYNLGVLSLDENRPTQAITYFEKAKRLGHPSPELAVNLVRAYLEAGDSGRGLKGVEQARKEFPNSAAVHLAIGNSLLAHRLIPEAAAVLKEADLLAPLQPDILLPLADSCLLLSDLICANDALAKARRTSEDTAEFHFLLGKADFLARHDNDGFRELEAAVERDPKNVKFLIALARFYQKFGQQQKAIAEFKAAGQLAPDAAEIPYGVAVSHFIQDDFSQAIEFCHKALELDPKFDRALFLLGISKFATNQLKEAEELLGKAIGLQPENAFYRCFQGMIQLSMDRLTEASLTFREAIRLEPSYALVHFQLGRTLVRMRSYPEARQELERAVSLQPDLGEAYYQLGTAYRKLGDLQKASNAFARFKQFRTAQYEERTEVLKQVQEAIQGKP